MSAIKISIAHKLARDEAVRRVKDLLSGLQHQHRDSVSDIKEDWKSNVGTFSFNAMGFPISGQITVNDNDVELKGDVPFAVSLFSGKIKSMITEKAQELLA